MTIIYGCKDGQSLDHMRYTKYMQLSVHGRPGPESLPPTKRAAYFHILRVHLQTVQWKLLRTDPLDATDWGWLIQDGQYVPIPTNLKVAPDDVLNVIVCECKNTSSCKTKNCTCHSYGSHCVPACKHCYGQTCTNAEPLRNTDAIVDNDDNDSNLPDADFDALEISIVLEPFHYHHNILLNQNWGIIVFTLVMKYL